MVDIHELERFLDLGPDASLWPLENMPGKSVFWLVRPGGGDLFVKCAPLEDVRRAWSYLSVATLDFVPKGIFFREWRGLGVMAVERMSEGHRRIRPEEMNLEQAKSLLAAHALLLEDIKDKIGTRGAKPLPDAAALYGTVASFAAHHPLAAPILKPLLSIPPEERTYDPATVTTIVNDFHCENYAFAGDTLSAVYDFDWMRLGTPCEDLTYSFVRRLRKARMKKPAREHVRKLFLELIRSSPYPIVEWKRAINICRLDAAAKRLRSHPKLGLIALDVRRRDAPLAAFITSLTVVNRKID